MKRLFKAVLLALVAILLISMPVLAAVAYQATYTIVESAGTAYTMLAVSELVDNEWMAANGFMESDALDTRIETLGGLVKPHMVATNKTLTAVAVPANSQTNLYYTTANSDLSSLDIITGYNGYITIDDDATLELGSDFEIEQKGYVNTAYVANKNLVYKQDAFRTYVSAAENITSTITYFTDVEQLAQDLSVDIKAGGIIQAGQRLDAFPISTITSVSFYLMKTGAPVGTAYVRLRRVSDEAIIGNFGSIDVATLSGVGFEWKEFTDNVTNPASQDVRMLIEYDGGDAGNCVTFGYRNADVVAGQLTHFVAAWSDEPIKDATYKYTIEESLSVTATGVSSGEYTVKTYGVANEPVWATGDVLHFTGANDSNINAGDIGDGNKLWVSLWFNLDTAIPTGGSGTDQYLIGKYTDADEFLMVWVEGADGKIYLSHNEAGVAETISTVEVAWATGWHHILASCSTVAGQRLIADGGTAVFDVGNTTAISLTPDDFCIGARDDGVNAEGFIGKIQSVVLGNGDLTVAQEAALYTGIIPTGANAPTEYWYIDEGTGTAITSYGSTATTGTADTACTWQTATYTTGKTGRWCDFYIQVASATTTARWGKNLKGASVPDGDVYDWLLNQTNVMPYMDYYYHTASGVRHAWYQPNYMVTATSFDGTADAGSDATSIVDAVLTQAADYWVGALVTITDTTDDLAPIGEARVCTVYAVGDATVAPAFSAAVDAGDTYTIDFGTLIDRSYYGVEFDAVDDVIACGAADDMDITDKATLTAWVYIDTDGETNEGSIIDRRDATDGYRLYVSSEAGVNVAIEAILDCATTDAYAKSAVEISVATWHYIVAVYDRLGTNHWEIYEDGTLLTLGTDTAGVGAIVAHTANVMDIGDNAASDRCFDGKIDEPSFYTRAFAQTEVTANYNAGVGSYTPYSTTSIALQLHMEEGTGAVVADTSGEANNGTITNALWVTGKVPRPAGNAGTNDSRVTWGANPTGVAVTIGGMVSSGQPVPGSIPPDPAQDILPETEVTDWFIEPAVGTTLLNNPLRPFVIMMSGDGSPTDTNTLTEIQAWRILALAMILLVTVATAFAVGKHQGITAIMAGAAILGAVVLTIFPMWALVFAIGMFIGGLVMERSPSL